MRLLESQGIKPKPAINLSNGQGDKIISQKKI
jgi:hypothetical protein